MQCDLVSYFERIVLMIRIWAHFSGVQNSNVCCARALLCGIGQFVLLVLPFCHMSNGKRSYLPQCGTTESIM